MKGIKRAPSQPLQELVCEKGGRFVLSYSRRRRNKGYASSVPMKQDFSSDSWARVLKVHHAGLPPASLSSSSFTLPIKGDLDLSVCL